MAIEIPSVESAQAILIRAGSELLRLEGRHDGSLPKVRCLGSKQSTL